MGCWDAVASRVRMCHFLAMGFGGTVDLPALIFLALVDRQQPPLVHFAKKYVYLCTQDSYKLYS